MGQAFDESGKVIGEAWGPTKRDVFGKLDEAHPDAAEIRIRTLCEQIDAQNGAPQVELPRYVSHKTVWALRIKRIHDESDGSATLEPFDERYAPFRVSAEYVRKHSPIGGGYFVRYKDGYESFSPSQAFEEGYSPEADAAPVGEKD